MEAEEAALGISIFVGGRLVEEDDLEEEDRTISHPLIMKSERSELEMEDMEERERVLKIAMIDIVTEDTSNCDNVSTPSLVSHLIDPFVEILYRVRWFQCACVCFGIIMGFWGNVAVVSMAVNFR